MRRLLVGLVTLAAMALFPGIASAKPQLYSELKGEIGTTVLRDVKAEHTLQPDALEFNNKPGEPVTLVINGEEKLTYEARCLEEEIGVTVVQNNTKTLKLAIPFGVAEECAFPTYFDTLGSGAVGAGGVAYMLVTEPAAGVFKATLHKLKLSVNLGTEWCTANFEGTEGFFVNRGLAEPLNEESTPNLTLMFAGAPFTIEGCAIGKSGRLYASYFAETLTTLTDTARIE